MTGALTRVTAGRPGRKVALALAVGITVLAVAAALGLVPGATASAQPRSSSPAAGHAAGSLSAMEVPPGAVRGDARRQGARGRAAGTGSVTLPVSPELRRAALPPGSPPVPEGSGSGRRVVFDQGAQRVWLVRADGTVARSYLVSGSVYDNLQPGSYEVYSRSERAVSYTGASTMRYMVRFAHGVRASIGFHDIPVQDGEKVQTRAELGSPRSDGCIRQWPDDARALWRFAGQGTTVVVV